MNEVIRWLLQGPAWLKYAVEMQLLDGKPDPKPALEDSPILKLIERLKDDQVGIPGLKAGRVSSEVTGNAYWDLFFLADIGFSIEDLGLSREVEEILNLQRPDGTFVTERMMSPDYFCVSAILLSSFAWMGYRDDPRVKRYLKVVMDSEQAGSGWHCGGGHGMGYTSNTQSCPMDNMNVLMFLSNYQEYREDSRVNGAIDLLVNHWEKRQERLILDGFGIGRRFNALQYPAVLYGILRVLDVLSLYPYARVSQGFQDMLDFVHHKSSDGKYFAESTVKSYSDFDFAQDKEPSRWITFLVKRVEKRVSASPDL